MTGLYNFLKRTQTQICARKEEYYMNKRFLSLVSALMTVVLLCSMCSFALAEDIKGQSIEVATYLSGNSLAALKQIIADFEAESGVTVVLDEYGDDYESTMKTRMASNQLPDVFETHGWSLIRYKEYLTDLSTQPWASDLSAAAMGVIGDTDGSFYTLMTAGSCLGVAANVDVCEAAGVDVWAINTWADFDEACAKIKEAGYTPISNYFTTAGALANNTGSWLTYENAQFDDAEAILDGTWDWADFKVVLEYLKTPARSSRTMRSNAQPEMNARSWWVSALPSRQLSSP